MRSSRNLFGRQDLRPPLAAAIVAGGLLMCAPQAHAGSWNIEVERTESGSGTTWNSSTGKLEPYTISSHSTFPTDNSFNFSPKESVGADRGSTASFDKTITYKIHLHFVPNPYNPNDLPPKMVAMQLQGNVSGTYDLPPADFQGGGGSITGSTGLTDTAAPEYDDPGSGGSYPRRHININGTLVAIYDNSKQKADITIGPITTKSKGTVTSASKTVASPHPYSGSGGSSTTYTTPGVTVFSPLSGTRIDYGVLISSNLEPSYKKVSNWSDLPTKVDANGYTFVDGSQINPSTPAYDANFIRTSGPWGVQPERKLDGSLTVESAATWNNYWRAGVNLTATALGYASPKYSWSVSGGTLTSDASTAVAQNSSQVNLNTSLSYIFLGGKTASLSSTTSTATVNVSDTSGATPPLSSSYAINWHMPRENWEQYGPTTQVWQQPAQCDANAPGYAVYGGGVNVTYALTDAELWGDATNDTYGALTSVIGASVPPPYSTLFAAAALYHPGTTPATVPVDFSSQWGLTDPATGNDICTYSPDRNNALENYYQMVPELQEGYTIKLWKGDIYGSNGFGGIDKKAIQAPDGRQQWISAFTRQVSPQTPPSTI